MRVKQRQGRLFLFAVIAAFGADINAVAIFDLVWQGWFDSGHEYGIRDEEFLKRGLKDILNFVMIAVKRKED